MEFIEPFGFNFNLFSINGNAMDFCLAGFDEVKFMEIARIVEAFGGKLSPPNVPGTLIFIQPTSNPNPSSELTCQFYDIKFLHDSIAAQKLQKLANYKVRSSVDQRVEKILIEHEPKNGSSGGQTSNYETDENCEQSEEDEANDKSSGIGESEGISSEPMEMEGMSTPKRHPSDIANDNNNSALCDLRPVRNEGTLKEPITVCDFGSSQEMMEEDNQVLLSAKHLLEAYPTDPVNDQFNSSSSEESEVSEGEESVQSYNTRQLRELENYQIPSSASSNKSVTPTTANNTFQDILNNELPPDDDDYVDDDGDEKNESSEDDVTCTAARVRIHKYKPLQNINKWNSNELNVIKSNVETPQTNRRRSALSNLIRGQRSRGSSETSFSEPKDSSSCFSPNSSEDETDAESVQSRPRKQQHEKKGTTRLKPNRYSDNDNYRMLRYVIDNDAIHLGGTQSIWEEFLQKEVLDKRKVTPYNLSAHYRNGLRRDYRKYLTDPEDLRKFEAKKKFTSRGGPWSEEDYRLMIKYLIDNNAIYRALSRTIWGDCLEAVPELQKSGKTSTALYSRFHTYLRYKYAKYTNDPDALKKFKDMESKQPAWTYAKKAAIEADSAISKD